MTTIQLKNALIQQISSIQDVSFLKAVKTILDSKAVPEIILSPSQKEDIQISKSQIAKGLFTEHEVLQKEIKQWLKEK